MSESVTNAAFEPFLYIKCDHVCMVLVHSKPSANSYYYMVIMKQHPVEKCFKMLQLLNGNLPPTPFLEEFVED